MKISVLESLLFVVGDEGLSIKQIKDLLEIDEISVLDLIERLKKSYDDRGIEIALFGDKYKLITKKENKEYIQKLMTFDESDNLSESALEVLAIVAYNQPITRSTIDEIRGVGSTYILRKLAFKNLIGEVGRSESAGRPLLYGTTDLFLDYFGLKTINDLPNIKVEEKEDGIDLYNSKFTEQV